MKQNIMAKLTNNLFFRVYFMYSSLLKKVLILLFYYRHNKKNLEDVVGVFDAINQFRLQENAFVDNGPNAI